MVYQRYLYLAFLAFSSVSVYAQELSHAQINPVNANTAALIQAADDAEHHQDLSKAIRIYRSLISQYPSALPIRLKLAHLLTQDQQDTAAKDQLERLNSQPLSSADYQQIVDDLNTIHARRGLAYSAYLGLRTDSNLDHVLISPPFPNPSPQEPESGFGVRAELESRYTWSIGKDAYIGIGGELGSNLWTKPLYNRYELSIHLPIGWQHTFTNIEVKPSITRHFFKNTPYATRLGISLDANHWITSQWQLGISGQWSHLNYDKETQLNGQEIDVKIQSRYVIMPESFIHGEIGFTKKSAQQASESYITPSLTLGWNQDWSYGISTDLYVEYEKQFHDAKDQFNILQQNDQLSVELDFWVRQWHWFGITPYLGIGWSRKTSNHYYLPEKENGQGSPFISGGLALRF